MYNSRLIILAVMLLPCLRICDSEQKLAFAMLIFSRIHMLKDIL